MVYHDTVMAFCSGSLRARYLGSKPWLINRRLLSWLHTRWRVLQQSFKP